MAHGTGERRGSRRHAAFLVAALLAGLLAIPGPPAAAAHQFPDVPDSNPFHEDIGWMVDLAITTGYSDDTFRPTNPVTRQSMAAFLHRLWTALGEEDPDPIPDPGFIDVPLTHPFYDDIAWLAAMDITHGFADGGYHPTAPVTRQSMAAFLHRLWTALGEEDPSSIPDPGFIDVPLTHPFYDDIAWLAAMDITHGFADGGYHPTATVTRQSMAAFLHRFSDAVPQPRADFVVDTPDDAPDADPGDGECADGSGDCSLRAAIDESNSLPGPHVIAIARGVDPTLSIAGAEEDLNATGDLDITDDLTLRGNGATIDAAGLDRVLHVPTGSLTLVEATITGGSLATVQTRGGGIHAVGDLHLSDSTVTGNEVTGTTSQGGGVAMGAGTISASTISNNTSVSYGGGLFVDAPALEDETVVSNTTISDNAGSQYATQVRLRTGTLRLRSSTVHSTTAGDALSAPSCTPPFCSPSQSRFEVSGSIIAATAVTGRACSWMVISVGWNLVTDSTCRSLTSVTSDIEGAEALIGPLHDNGGSTLTRLPATDSPAVDSIPTGTPVLCDGTIPTDQRGAARPDGVACDRGAVEGAGPPIVPLALTVDSPLDLPDLDPGDGACTTTAGACTLRAAVDESNAWQADDTITVAPGVDPELTIPGVKEDLNATGDLDVVDSVVIDGGGATVDAGMLDRVMHHQAGHLEVHDLTLTGGSAILWDSGLGGAILTTADADHDDMSALTLDRVVFTSNTALQGGALASDYPTSTVPPLVVTRSTMAGNTATQWPGGGAVSLDGGMLVIESSTISANQAPIGGGVNVKGGRVTLRNTTISGNSSPQGYSAIHGGNVTLDHVTVTGSGPGPAMGPIQSSWSATASILSGGGEGVCGPEVTGPVDLTSNGFNLVDDHSCGVTATGDVQGTGAEPLLGPLADNGGPTLTRLPGVGSPARNAIPAGTVGLCDGTLPTDQRGVARPQGGACDIGAVEQ